MTVKEIYNIINRYAPFSLQYEWDNCGILVGNPDKEINNVLTCLDITCDVVREAIESKTDLIISHHPVIFKGLKILSNTNPAVMLSNADIAAICCHTNVDIAPDGLNAFLCEKLGFVQIKDMTLTYDEGLPLGIICESQKPLSANELSQVLIDALKCDALRFFDSGKSIKRIAICTGSGGDYIGDAMRNNCDVLITGDVKHNSFTDAKNNGISLFDAGHYHTECIFSEWISKIIDCVKIRRAKSDIAPYKTVLNKEF